MHMYLVAGDDGHWWIKRASTNIYLYTHIYRQHTYRYIYVYISMNICLVMGDEGLAGELGEISTHIFSYKKLKVKRIELISI